MISQIDWNEVIAHVDMDAFFAQIEERDYPYLKGKPVIIGGLPGHRGVASTCNYIARKFGVRSGSREEFTYANTIGSLYDFTEDGLNRALKSIDDKPLYISLDLDVLDPSLLPGTGNPEPGGIDFHEMIMALQTLARARVIGFDIVELSPDHDPSEVSSIVTAQLVREMILNYWSK